MENEEVKITKTTRNVIIGVSVTTVVLIVISVLLIYFLPMKETVRENLFTGSVNSPTFKASPDFLNLYVYAIDEVKAKVNNTLEGYFLVTLKNPNSSLDFRVIGDPGMVNMMQNMQLNNPSRNVDNTQYKVYFQYVYSDNFAFKNIVLQVKSGTSGTQLSNIDIELNYTKSLHQNF